MNPFSTITSGVVALFATHKYFEYAYPIKTVEFDNYVKWQTLKTFTVTEMATRRLRKYATNKVLVPLKNFFPSCVESKCILLIRDGHVESYLTPADIPNEKNTIKHDMIIYKHETLQSNEKYDYDMLRFKDVSNISETFEPSSVKFLAIQVKIGGKEPISLDFGRNNFYIKGNILFDRPFIKWFLSEKSGITTRYILKDNESYEVEFINHKMNCDRITSGQCVIIDEDDYIIAEADVISDHGSSSESSSSWNMLDKFVNDSNNDSTND
jgi:hypothetical protein